MTVTRCLCGRESHEGDCGRVTDHIDFRLAYGCTQQPREWAVSASYETVIDVLRGPLLPNAYDFGETDGPGDWMHPDGIETVTEALFVVVGEAVHEALEWFRVDGKMFLDPHGGMEMKIHNHVRELVTGLIAAKSLEDAEEED